MARAEIPSTHQQAGYMYASLSRRTIEESSCMRGGSIYEPEKPHIAEDDFRIQKWSGSISEIETIIG